MSWDRGAWEKKTSQGAPYIKNDDNSVGEIINQGFSTNYVNETHSGGISFCPNCGSMMMNRNGVYTCSCGYTKSDTGSSKTINHQHKSRDNRLQIKQNLNDVLNYMRQGKTRSQAAALCGISIYTVNNWYNKGMQSVNSDYVHFYHEVKSIETDRRNAERQERIRKERIEKERRQKARKERVETTGKTDYTKPTMSIRDKMEKIISAMRMGKTRSQAISSVGVSSSEFLKWYELGEKNRGTDYIYFYNEISKIENKNSTSKPKQNKTKYNSNTKIKCPKCGKYYSKYKPSCPHCTSNSTALLNVNYCQNCGKRITNSDLNYCSECGNSLIEVKTGPKAKTTVKPSASGNCCAGLMVMFIIIAILIVMI